MGKRPVLRPKKQPFGQTIKKFFDRKVEKRIAKPCETSEVVDLCEKENGSCATGPYTVPPAGRSRSPSPFAARPASNSSSPLYTSNRSTPQPASSHPVLEDIRPQEHESEEQRVVYKSSPTQRAPSEPPEAVPSLSGRQISADEETLRQRLISAVQRPSGSENTGQLADNLSLRYMEEDRSHQTTLDSTPHCAAGSARAPGNRSGTPSRKPGSRSKSTSKTPSERVRSGSAVKRSQDLAFGSPLGSQPGRREVLLKRAMRDRQRSGSGSGAKPGTSTARRRKRRALLDILEKVEVAVKEAKEEDSENESTEETVLRKSASLSFERVSQEIEKASQEMPSARQAPPEQHARPDVSAAPEAAPRAEHSMYSASQQPLGQHAGSAGARHAHSSETHTAEQLKQRKSQRSPLKPLNRSGSLATQQATRASQDANQGPSQPIRCAGSELLTPSMSGASQLRVRKQDEQRQMPTGDRGHPQLLARCNPTAGCGAASHPASVRPPGPASGRSAALQHSAARGTHHPRQRQPFADVQQQLLGRHAQPLSSHTHGVRPQLSQAVSQTPRPQSLALQQPQGLSSASLSSSQQPNWISSDHQKAQSTGVFAAKNSGIFADDDEGEEDADWDAGVAKLLASAALSRPPQLSSQPLAQEQPCFSGRTGSELYHTADWPGRAVPSKAPLLQQAPPVRYKVAAVLPGDCEKQLVVRDEARSTDITVHLLDGWMDTPAEAGDVVHVLADVIRRSPNEMGHATCSASSGIVVLQPDVLLSGTRISGSFKCARQSVLEERFGGDSNARAVEGTLLHDLLQVALMTEHSTLVSLQRTAKQIVEQNAEKLLDVGLEDTQAEKVLQDAIPALLGWLQRFRRPDPDQSAVLEVRGQQHGTCMEAVAVSEVLDIEESIWVPRYGLKGMLDASVRLRCQQYGPQGPAASPAQVYTAPLEFKSGRPHQSHRAQVTLYQLMMEERYGQAIERGLLWYLNEASPEVVSRSPYEVASLIMQRNVLAARLGRQRSLPPMLQDAHACSRCFQVTNCALLHKATEDGTSESAGMGDAFEDRTRGMTPERSAFLAHWLRLVDLEEGDQSARRAEIWALPGAQREEKGRCVAGLRLATEEHRQAAGAAEKPSWDYLFARAPGTVHPSQKAAANLQDACLAQGDMVILSIEGRHTGMGRGFVAQVSKEGIRVALDKRLRPAFAGHAQRAPSGDLPGPGSVVRWAGGRPPEETALLSWRLDKDDVASVFVRLRRNLMGLFSAKDARTERLRELIVDLKPPAPQTPAPAAVESAVQQSGLNAEQEYAVKRITGVQDYTLLLGMPGTGKSSTIVQAVKALVAAKRSVLLMSYTNSAVDNLLMKLAAEDVPFLRIGRAGQVHPHLHDWMPGGGHHPDTSVRGLRATAQEARVVGCTCLSAGHALLQSRVFDVCIIDEAGQITLPAVLGALMRAQAFCLVGDHHQLPPLVQNPAAAEQGLGCSLFRRLCDAHPEAVVMLQTQYRMCDDIMAIANALTYGGRLRCGNALVEHGMLSLTSGAPESAPAWLQQVLDPKQRVSFLDTSALPSACERLAGDQLSNPGEADIIMLIVQSLQGMGLPTGSIGVISPYRSQVTLLQRLAKQRGWDDLEALTIDRCQGRDKDVVLISLVRNNEEQMAGKLLADERRVNVMLTRAKLKLVICGAQRMLCMVPVMQLLWDFCSQRKWTAPILPEDLGEKG